MKKGILSIGLWLFPRIVSWVKMHRSRRNSFSQFGEDIVLWNLLGQQKSGFYVDCGAFDPFIYSNTAIFYRAGWRGINIEPLVERWKMFRKLRPRDINLCEVVSNSPDDVEFFESDMPTLSGVNNAGLYEFEGTSVMRKPCSLLAVLSHYCPDQQIDFISIDCEGHDLEVMKSNDWVRFRARLIAVEDHQVGVETEIDKFMKSIDYKFIIKLGPTKIFNAA